MSFNPDPNKQATEVVFSRKRIPMIQPPILFNDSPVTGALAQTLRINS